MKKQKALTNLLVGYLFYLHIEEDQEESLERFKAGLDDPKFLDFLKVESGRLGLDEEKVLKDLKEGLQPEEVSMEVSTEIDV